MHEIDNGKMNMTADDVHAAVLPTLASDELQASLERRRKRRKISTGCAAIDEVLRGGIESGGLTCISGDGDTGKSTIALHLVVTLLQRSEDSEAVVIDTTGSFDVFRLHQILISRLSGLSEDEKSMRSEQMLHRLKIIRVFDLDGVLEAVAEVERELSPTTEPAPTVKRVPRRGKETGEIPDSEDEDSLSDVSDEIMDTASPPQRAVEMLLIDNLTTVINPLLKSNHVKAQSQLVTFLRSLSSMTRHFNLSTLLINGVVHHQRASATAVHETMTHTQPATGQWDSPSIFMANDFRPALGRSFLHFIDLHLLLSTLPKSERDARVKYERNVEPGETPLLLGLAAEMVNIVEVIADRYSNRIGRWTPYRIERGLALVQV